MGSDALHSKMDSPQNINNVVIVVQLLQPEVVVLVDSDLLEGLLELTHLVSRGHTEYGRPLLVFHLGQTVIISIYFGLDHLHGSHTYAIKTQRKARNHLSWGLWVACVSLWHKRAGVATP